MGATWLCANCAGVGQNDNLTQYWPIVGTLTTNTSANRARIDIPVASAGTFSGMTLHVSANTASVTSVWTLQDDSVNTALTLNVTTDATGDFADTTHSATVAAGSLIAYELAIPTEAGTNTLTVKNASVVWTATTGTTSLVAGCAANTISAGGTFFIALGGAAGEDSTEASGQSTVGVAFSGSNFFVMVSANTWTAASTFKTRINGADGAGSGLVFATTETGLKQDATAQTIAATNTLGATVTLAAGSGSITPRIVGMELTSTNGDWHLVTAVTDSVTQAFNVTNNVEILGWLGYVSTTETGVSGVQITPLVTFAVSKLYTYVSTNTIATSATTVTLRVDAANSALTVSYAAAETGTKSDTSNSVTVTNNTNAINWQIVTPNTSGTFTLRSISAIGHIDVAGVTADQLIGVFDQQLSGAFVGLVYQ
jgi:hypothetical protein